MWVVETSVVNLGIDWVETYIRHILMITLTCAIRWYQWWFPVPQWRVANSRYQCDKCKAAEMWRYVQLSLSSRRPNDVTESRIQSDRVTLIQSEYCWSIGWSTNYWRISLCDKICSFQSISTSDLPSYYWNHTSSFWRNIAKIMATRATGPFFLRDTTNGES